MHNVDWQEFWQQLINVAVRCNLKSMCLDADASAMSEGYHARWNRFGTDSQPNNWRIELPVNFDGRQIGRLAAVGLCDSEPILTKLQQLSEVVQIG